MTENDYTLVSPVEALPTVAVTHLSPDDSRQQKKRRNAHKEPREQADLVEDRRIEPAADETENPLPEEGADGQHVDCRV